MRPRRLALVLSLPLLLLAPAAVAQEAAEVEITTTRVTDSIYMLEGQGGNIGVCIGEDGTFLVDDQFAPLTEDILAAIAEIGGGAVQFVVNTHWHYDHTDGNENLGEAGALIVSHENSRRRMESQQVIEYFEYTQEPYAGAALPKITFDTTLRFHYNGDTIEVFHRAAAHTDGDAVVFFRDANVVHTGDVFVRYGLPFIDQPNGGDVDGMIATLAAIADMTDSQTRIIPGHGPLSTRADLLDFHDMLVTIRDRVRESIAAGHDLEATVAADPTRGFPQSGIETTAFVKMVYDSLMADR